MAGGKPTSRQGSDQSLGRDNATEHAGSQKLSGRTDPGRCRVKSEDGTGLTWDPRNIANSSAKKRNTARKSSILGKQTKAWKSKTS